ncbi:MAG: hypothetical protein WC352_09545 [Candidatus Omnitrophota bacterium]|jgi:RNA polymerase-interacting CarD/CdnL/TRCF family regulator
MRAPIAKDDLLFHFVHGLCRVAQVFPADRKAELSYSLLPVAVSQAKVRFLIPQSSMEESGFGKLITAREARDILDFFKTGTKKDSQCNQAWMQASLIRSEARSREPIKDARKRQRLEHSVRGLAGAMALVLKVSPSRALGQIRKNLGAVARINPLVLTVLENSDTE